MNMELIVKPFYELSIDQLYGILRLRAEVFVVEQNCPYQDLDGNDRKAWHLFAIENGNVVGCLRVFKKEDGNATIGRVALSRNCRGTGLGKRMIQAGIAISEKVFGTVPIIIHAQCYAIGFYEKCGFSVSSDEFAEDGIPHREMTFGF